MNKLSWAEVRKIGVNAAIEHLPLAVTLEGEVKFYAVKESDVIIIGDLHPRVRNMLRAMEKKARAGMSTKPLTLEDIKQVEEPSKES